MNFRSTKKTGGRHVRFCVCLIGIGAIAVGQHRPDWMTKLSVRLESPEVQEGSFAAKPKLMYRAGDAFCRTEEVPDSESGVHGLMIVNESWTSCCSP
jgi:hypothetical protein